MDEEFSWRMMHCGAADRTVPVVGDERADTMSLCERVGEVAPGGGAPGPRGPLPAGDGGGR